MIITIEGKKGEGKTSLARDICHGERVFEIEEQMLNSPFWTNEMAFHTETIIVDEVVNYRETRELFNKDLLEINKKGKHPINIKMPDVILVLF